MEQEEIVEDGEKAALCVPPDPRKRGKLSAIDGASSDACLMCDAAIEENILARLPARAAIACMTLSKRHRRLIRSPEFRILHCRLGAPLPHPHIAYLTTALGRQRGYRGRVSEFHGFHVAGAGLSSSAPIRALAGGRYLKKKYVNTCNGIVLLASEITKNSPTTKCVLWNPAVADDDKEVAVPCQSKGSYRILGLGYGRRSKTYKLLLSRRCRLDCEPPEKMYSNELLVYRLGTGGAEEQPRSVMVLPEGTMCGGIIQESLYMDGTIYLLHDFQSTLILAFDVDDETVTTIDVPGERDPDSRSGHARSKLMVMSGRPFLTTNHGHHRVALWLLTADHQWQQVCVIGNEGDAAVNEEDVDPSADRCRMSGIWDCGGVLAMYMDIRAGEYDHLCLYDIASEKMFKANLPRDLTPEEMDFALCWGYKPTLVSPGDVVGELSQDEEKRRRRTAANVMDALKPVTEKDKWKGHEETLDTVCFMNFLVRIMRKLPDNLQDVLEMPMLNPGGPGFFFENASFSRIHQQVYWTNYY